MRVPAAGRLASVDGTGLAIAIACLLLAALTVLAGRVSPWAFVASGAALLAMTAVAAYRYPRAGLAALLVGPLFDRTLLDRMVPTNLTALSGAFGEMLLVVIGPAILLRALHEGRARRVLTGWPLALLLTFLVLAGVSALVNSVPPVVAVLGLTVTVDAIALFFLAPLAGVDLTRGSRIVWFFAIVIGIASLIAVLQALLGTTILGLSATAGRSGEGVRIGSLVGDPNAFGVLIGMVLTVPIAAAAFSSGRGRLLAVGFALVLAVALLFTYSRGAWFGTLIGIVAASLLTRQLRLLSYAVGIGLVALLLASVLPRDVLGSRPPQASPRAIGTGTPTTSATPSRSASPSASNIPSSDFLGSAIDRALRIASGSDLRARLVRNAGPILAEHPILGVGPGRYGGAVAAWYPTPVYRAYGTNKLLTYQIGFKKFFHQQTVDNFWLHLVVESGILGTLAFGGLILLPLLRIARATREATEGRVVLTAIVAAGLVGVFSSVSTMLLEANAGAFPFWLLLGLGWSIVRLREVQAG